MIKIVFFDIDGTLIDIGAKRMAPKTKDALLRLKAVAHDVCAPVSEDGVYRYCAEHGLI